MPIWSDNYKNSPRDWKNPGEGAYNIRDFKEAVEERETREHVFGQDESTLTVNGGTHKEGSARVLVTDQGSGSRPAEERFTGTTRPGRVVVDLTNLDPGAFREQDGVKLNDVTGLSYLNQTEKKIKVASTRLVSTTGIPVDASDPTETELVTVFDYDAFIDIIQDQVANGIKRFILSPQVPDIAEVGAPSVREGWQDFVDTASAFEKLSAVNVDETNTVMNEARNYNIFDVEDQDNPITEFDDPSRINPIDLSHNTTENNVSADIVVGNKVYGAVYN